MYVKRILPNGVRLITERIDNMRTVSVGIWVGNGSRYEPAELGGVSHFIEHMIFKGTEKRSARHIAIAIDALGGQANAFTDKECTCYYMKVLDSRLKNAVALLADMFLHSRFAQEDLELERGVVLEEIDMYRDTPEDIVVEQLMGRIFPGALGKPVLGRPASLNGMTGASLRAFKEREYSPERIVVSVCGSFTEDNLARLCSRFSALAPSRPAACRKSAYTPAVVVKRKATEQNHFCLSFPGLPDGDADRFSWQVLSMALGGGMSSRLFQSIREQSGLCYSIYTFTTPHLDTGLMSIYTGLGEETERQALERILQELHRFCEDGPAKDEISRTREQAKTTLLMGLESTGTRMMTIGRSELMRGEVSKIEDVLAAYDSVTYDDILNLARRVFDPAKASLAVVGNPGTEDEYRELLAKHL